MRNKAENTDDWVECECGETFPKARFDLGFKTCLRCGESKAQKEIEFKRTCVAPAYNKGAYQYIGSEEMARDAGKK